MTIKVGDKIPNITISTMSADGPVDITTDEIFGGKKVVMFALPGAFTPTCSTAHVPGYVVHNDAIKAKGVDTIACLSVNDAFVMGAWGESQNVDDNILMLGDGSASLSASLTQALGLELDLTERNFGIRSQRYALIAEDGIVTHLNLEPAGGLEVSDAETILKLL
jgi:peroxiredoxin (alkyl hydroperoxide reductase subunit C)